MGSGRYMGTWSWRETELTAGWRTGTPPTVGSLRLDEQHQGKDGNEAPPSDEDSHISHTGLEGLQWPNAVRLSQPQEFLQVIFKHRMNTDI